MSNERIRFTQYGDDAVCGCTIAGGQLDDPVGKTGRIRSHSRDETR